MSKYGASPAYFLDPHDGREPLTFCTSCAYTATALPFVLVGRRMPHTMEEAITDLLLIQIEREDSQQIVPSAVPHPTGTCDSCGREFVQEEVA